MYSLHVFLQLFVSWKNLFTNSAGQFPVEFVNFQVVFQVGFFVEMASAWLALEWSFPRVYEHVVSQVAFLVEALATFSAHVLLQTAVRPHVHLQRRRSVEVFPAQFALVRLVACVDDLMSTQCTGEPKTFAANIADERSLFRMFRHPYMYTVSVVSFKALPTLAALISGFVLWERWLTFFIGCCQNFCYWSTFICSCVRGFVNYCGIYSIALPSILSFGVVLACKLVIDFVFLFSISLPFCCVILFTFSCYFQPASTLFSFFSPFTCVFYIPYSPQIPRLPEGSLWFLFIAFSKLANFFSWFHFSPFAPRKSLSIYFKYFCFIYWAYGVPFRKERGVFMAAAKRFRCKGC